MERSFKDDDQCRTFGFWPSDERDWCSKERLQKLIFTFSDRYVVNAPLLRSLFCLSVCLWRAWAASWQRIFAESIDTSW